jgi:hypothetical protein
MKLPGFTADASLKHATGEHRFQGLSSDFQPIGSGVMAAFRRQTIGGCGPCSELKWPNGTGTGACMQDCCDLLGNCKFQACTCGGGSSSAFATRSFSRGSFARF